MERNYVRKRISAEDRREREAEIALKNKRLGINIFQASWILVFVCLIVVNWQLRFSFPEYPPAGTVNPSPIIAAGATLVILISTYFARRGLQMIRNDEQDAFASQWRLAIGLGVVFLLLALYQFSVVQSPQSLYVNILRLMIGYHALHALAIIIMMVIVDQNARQGAYHAGHYWVVEAATRLWYFVTIAWILFYIVLYWI